MAVPFGVVKSTTAANASATSVTSTAMLTTSGNLLVVIVTDFSNTIPVAPITDNKGNTWVSAIGNTGLGSGWGAMFYAKNITGGAGHTVTFTPTGSDFNTITVIEIAGADLTSPLSNTATSADATAIHAAGPITSNASTPEVFIGGGSVSSGVTPVITPADPRLWWELAAVTGAVTEGCINGWRLVGTGVSDSYSFTAGVRREACMIAGFKAAASGGGGGGACAFTFFGP